MLEKRYLFKRDFRWSTQFRSFYVSFSSSLCAARALSADQLSKISQDLDLLEAKYGNVELHFASGAAVSLIAFVLAFPYVWFRHSHLVGSWLRSHIVLHLGLRVVGSICVFALLWIYGNHVNHKYKEGDYVVEKGALAVKRIQGESKLVRMVQVSLWSVAISCVLVGLAVACQSHIAVIAFALFPVAFSMVATVWLSLFAVIFASLAHLARRHNEVDLAPYLLSIQLMALHSLLKTREGGFAVNSNRSFALLGISQASRSLLRMQGQSARASGDYTFQELSIRLDALKAWIRTPKADTSEQLSNLVCNLAAASLWGALDEFNSLLPPIDEGIASQVRRRRTATYVAHTLMATYLIAPLIILGIFGGRLSLASSTLGQALVATIYAVWVLIGFFAFADTLSNESKQLLGEFVKNLISRK